MNILGSKLQKCCWLDLFSGSGVMSCEALQRGAEHIVAVEIDRKTAQTCKYNLLSTASGISHKNNIHVIRSEVINWLKDGFKKFLLKSKNISCNTDQRFDLVYLDPPYDTKLYPQVLESLLKGNWVKKNALVVYEHPAGFEIEKPSEWFLKDRRVYGGSGLLFLSPTQALHCFDDTDSKH